MDQVKKICLKTFAALSASVLLLGNTCVFAKEIAIPQTSPVDDDLPISAEISLMDLTELGDVDSDNEIDTASIDESDVTVEVKILDEYKLPDFSVPDEKEYSKNESSSEENSNSSKNADTESDSADDNEQDGIEAQAASLPDLAVLNLSPKNYKDADTLPLSTQIPFSFQVGNYGSQPSPKAALKIYFAGSLKVSEELPAISPGTGLNLEVGIRCEKSGNYMVKLEVNPSKAFSESNFNNNTIEKSFKWGSGTSKNTGLSLWELTMENKKEPVFQQYVEQTFEMVIANTSNEAAVNPQIKIELMTAKQTPFKDSTQTINGTMAAGRVYRVPFKIRIDRRGGYILKVTVVPPSAYTDPDTKDNTAEMNLIVTYGSNDKKFCTHFRKGKFPDRTALQIYKEGNVTVVSDEQIAQAASYWNGITDKISYKSLSTTSQKEISIKQIESFSSEYPNAIAITDSKPDNDARTYTGADVVLSKMMFDKFTNKGNWSAEHRKIACVSHELGHVIGLDHANVIDNTGNDGESCGHPSIMTSAIYNKDYSADLEEHDMYNLYYRYAR